MDSTHRPPQGARQFSPTDLLPFVAVPPGEQPVQLRDLDIRVIVSGLLAETTQTMLFFNPNHRDLEGNLSFPLPDGAVVCGYALDVGGVMVDGVVVPRQEARRILEAEERKGVDPGLVEQVQGNLYRTRIYPIPAQGTRTIRVTYLSHLAVLEDDAAYDLPLGHARDIESVSLRIEVAQAPVQPVMSGGLGNLSLHRWEDRWVAEARLGRDMPVLDLQVRLPSLPEHFTSVERTTDGDLFFCISSRLPDEEDRAEKPTPHRVAVAWDASGSRSDIERDLTFLRDLLEGWPGAVVDVRVFRHRLEEEAAFDTGNGGTESLLAWLRHLPCDGGTSLAALDFGNLPHADDELWLLFTDGLGTVGRGLPAFGAKPVVAVASRAGCNSALLECVARRSGGVFVNLLRLPIEAARRAVGRVGETLRVAESSGCADLHLGDVGGRLAVTGRLLQASGRVRLEGPGAPEGSLGVNADSAVSGSLIARAWAGREAQEVALLEGEGADRVVALGRAHGLVTPGTSLLVLESLDQYLEHGIEPPASLPALREAFLKHRSQAKQERDDRRSERLERVVRMWEQRIAWWERDFFSEWEQAKKKAEAEAEAPRPRRARSSGATLGAADEVEAFAANVMSPSPSFDLRADAEADLICREEAAYAVECGEPAPEELFSPPRLRPREPCPAPPAPSPAQERPPSPDRGATIAVKPWMPDAPYLDALRSAPEGQAYRTYLEQRETNADCPAFFFDCADHLLERGEREMGLRVLSNLPEMGLDDPALLRMYAWRLQQAGELDASVAVLEAVRESRPDEPQSHRDLGLALGLRWERDRDQDDLERAVDLLYEVVLREWERFPEIEIIALMELNRLLQLAERQGIAVKAAIDARLRKSLDLDVRISMSWDADLTDVDLHVFEPTGEHAYYGHNLTAIGGLVSRDIRVGYGPEEYVLRRAWPGVYTIKAHYFGSTQQTLTGACTVTATVWTGYGRPDEKKQVLMIRLERPSDEVVVGDVTIGACTQGAHATV